MASRVSAGMKAVRERRQVAVAALENADIVAGFDGFQLDIGHVPGSGLRERSPG